MMYLIKLKLVELMDDVQGGRYSNFQSCAQVERVYDVLGTPHQHLVGVSKPNKKVTPI